MRLFSGTLACALLLAAQDRPDVAAQRAAMRKLSFLVGTWSGDATVNAGPGRQIHIRQTEDVQYKLDGLVLLIEGTGRDASGKAVFSALATVSFDDLAKTYHIRAYNDGNYVDGKMQVTGNGFEWGFESGPVTVRNVMRLTDQAQWSETTDTIMSGGRQFRTVEMLLTKAK